MIYPSGLCVAICGTANCKINTNLHLTQWRIKIIAIVKTPMWREKWKTQQTLQIKFLSRGSRDSMYKMWNEIICSLILQILLLFTGKDLLALYSLAHS